MYDDEIKIITENKIEREQIFWEKQGLMDAISQMHLSQKKMKKLSEDELSSLWQQYITDRSNKKIKDILIVQYIYLIKYVVGRIKVSLPDNVASEDISGFGVEGLINAIERFTPDKNARFETYAITRIRGAIIDRIREQDWVPRAVRKKQKEINAVSQLMQKELGRMPTDAEIAQKVGLTEEKFQEIMKNAHVGTVVSLNAAKDKQDQGIEIIDTLQDENQVTPLEKLEEKDSKKDLVKGLARLPERERMLLTLYYHENMTFAEIGAMMKISESRCCQLHAQAIMKLRNILTANTMTMRRIVEK